MNHPIDIMNNSNIIVLIAVVVIVAVAGVFLLTGGDENEDKDYSEIDVKTSLAVFGNANGDALINDYDVDILNDIISGKKSMDDYPLADANQDGIITDDDVAIVKKLMAHEPCKVNVLCLDIDKKQIAVEVDYPLDRVVTCGSSMNMTVLYVNGAEHTAGFFASKYPNLEAPLYELSEHFGGSLGSVEAGWANFTAKDGALKDQGGVGAFLADYTSKGAITEQYQKDLRDAGIPLLFFANTSATDEISAALLIGFLFGGDNEKVAYEYATTSWKVLDNIDSKTSKLSNSEKANFISITMGANVAKNSSDNYTTISEAGAIPYYEINPDYKEKFDVSSSVKITTGETLANYDDADFIISVRSVDSKSDNLARTMVDTWDKYYTYFNDLDNYENLVYINNLLPGAIKLAYLLEYMYPDLVDDGYGDAVFDSIAEICSFLDGCTVENTFTAMSYTDYKAAGGTH